MNTCTLWQIEPKYGLEMHGRMEVPGVLPGDGFVMVCPCVWACFELWNSFKMCTSQETEDAERVHGVYDFFCPKCACIWIWATKSRNKEVWWSLEVLGSYTKGVQTMDRSVDLRRKSVVPGTARNLYGIHSDSLRCVGPAIQRKSKRHCLLVLPTCRPYHEMTDI